jgi:hypothetical protein
MKSSEYIHIDAFEMDYETEPFIMLIKSFYNYLNNEMKIDKKLLNDFTSKAKKVFSKSLRTISKIGINAITSKLTGNGNANELISDLSEILFDELIINESEESSLYEKLKEVLGKITEKLEKPLYVIIDELDRCRPSFALETLEKIKHIFQVKNIKFILVYNNYILESIIEKTYGISNGNRYLDKFIQKTIVIDNSYYFSNWLQHEFENLKERYPKIRELLYGLEDNHQIFSKIKNTYDISLRDFKTLFSNLLGYRKILNSPNNLLLIIIFETMKMLDYKKYMELKNNAENNINLNFDSPETAMILNIKELINCSSTLQEIDIMFKKFINGEYR